MFFKCTRFQDSVHTTHTHSQGNGTERKKKIDEKEDFHDLKELTGGMMELVPGRAGAW